MECMCSNCINKKTIMYQTVKQVFEPDYCINCNEYISNTHDCDNCAYCVTDK